MSNIAKKFDILATGWAFYVIILIIQQNYFSDLYPVKILNLSAKSFFPYIYVFFYYGKMTLTNQISKYYIVNLLYYVLNVCYFIGIINVMKIAENASRNSGVKKARIHR